MPTYVSLINYTDQGIRNVKDSPKRLDAAKKLLKDLGGEPKNVDWIIWLWKGRPEARWD